MKKNRFISIYCIIVILICGYIVFQMEQVPLYFLRNIKNESIPVTSDQSGMLELLDEFIPMVTMLLESPSDELYLVEGDYSEYTWDLEATMIADDGNYNQEDGEMHQAEENTNKEDDTNQENNTMNQEDSSIGETVSEENNGYYVPSSVSGVSAYTDENLVVDAMNANRGIFYNYDDLSSYEFLLKNCYNVDSSTSVNPDEINANNLLSQDMSVDLSGEDYKVLIYHTHGSEAFADSREGEVADTVIGLGDELTRILEEEYGVHVYHDRNVYDMVDGVLDRSKAYDLSGAGVDAILEQYPSIEVVIDLHRDGVREDIHLVREVDGKQTAQIMFVNGVSRLNMHGDISYLYNPNKIANLAFSLKMHLAGKQMYGDLMRNIYISGYRYNLDKRPKACLAEIGAQTNTVEEVRNAMEPFAAIIYRVLVEG